MTIRGFFEVLWITALFGGLLVPIAACCATLPKVDGTITVDFADVDHEEPSQPVPKE